VILLSFPTKLAKFPQEHKTTNPTNLRNPKRLSTSAFFNFLQHAGRNGRNLAETISHDRPKDSEGKIRKSLTEIVWSEFLGKIPHFSDMISASIHHVAIRQNPAIIGD
jgi:hypothetical protein